MSDFFPYRILCDLLIKSLIIIMEEYPIVCRDGEWGYSKLECRELGCHAKPKPQTHILMTYAAVSWWPGSPNNSLFRLIKTKV